MSKYSWLEATSRRIAEDVGANRLAHALLLSGGEGIGVAEFAGEIATYPLCFNARGGETGQACGQCKACALLKSGTHPDLKVLEPEGAAQIIRVDQVRELVNFMSQTPQIGDWKVAVIRPAHRMNLNAANALLKVLEEPPGQSLLLLATERPQTLLPTVRSRCTQLRLPGPNESQVDDYLASSGVEPVLAAEVKSKIGLKPLLIEDWIHSDLLSAWRLLRAEIDALERKKSNAVKAALALKELDMVQLTGWLLEYVSEQMTLSFGTDFGKHWSESQNPMVFKSYEQLYDILIETRAALESGTNPNAQLTLESIFLDWPVTSC